LRQIWWSGKEPVTFDVEINSLKKMGQIGNAITSPFENFELVIEAFDKAAGFDRQNSSEYHPTNGRAFG